jgi:hypothetical protein
MVVAEVGVWAWAALEADVDLVAAAGVAAGVRPRIASAPSAPPPMLPITKRAAAAIAVRLGRRRKLPGGAGGVDAGGGSGGSYGNGPVTMSLMMRGASLRKDDEELRRR